MSRKKNYFPRDVDFSKPEGGCKKEKQGVRKRRPSRKKGF